MEESQSRDPLKVTFVTRKWRPAIGGIETYSEKLHVRLHGACDVHLLALPGDESRSTTSPLRLLAFGTRSAARLLTARIRPDVVHVTDIASWPLAVAARLRSRATRLVLSAHGTDVAYAFRDGLRPWLYRHYLRIGSMLLPRATVIANSVATMDLVTRSGFAGGTVIPLGTDFEPRTEPLDRSAVLFAGRLVRLKGCRWFAEEVLPKLGTDFELRVAGEVWDAPEAEVFHLPRVLALGRLDQDQLAIEYARSLCVVVPNTDASEKGFEGFGLVGVDAAAAGGVVLASAVHGLVESVIDGQTGISLPPADTDAWVEAIRGVRAWDDEERTSFVARASEAARTRFDWDRVAAMTMDVYRDYHR